MARDLLSPLCQIDGATLPFPINDPADTTPDKLESAGHPFGRGCNFGTYPPNLCVLARIGDRPFQQIVCDLLNALVRAVGAGPVRPRDHVAGGTG